MTKGAPGFVAPGASSPAQLLLFAEPGAEIVGCGYHAVDGCRGRLHVLREVRTTPTTTTVEYTCLTCGRDWAVSDNVTLAVQALDACDFCRHPAGGHAPGCASCSCPVYHAPPPA